MVVRCVHTRSFECAPLSPLCTAAVSGLRDEFSQEVSLNRYPTPDESSPATPNQRRHSRPYSSDVDTGEASYDVVADSASVISAPIIVSGRRRGVHGSQDELRSSSDLQTVEAVIDKLAGECPASLCRHITYYSQCSCVWPACLKCMVSTPLHRSIESLMGSKAATYSFLRSHLPLVCRGNVCCALADFFVVWLYIRQRLQLTLLLSFLFIILQNCLRKSSRSTLSILVPLCTSFRLAISSVTTRSSLAMRWSCWLRLVCMTAKSTWWCCSL